MKGKVACGLLAMALSSGVGWGQQAARSAHLELSTEVATTTDEGYPSSLRLTITNAGAEAVTMPVPVPEGCAPDNGIRVIVAWTAPDSKHDFGGGGGCGMGDQPSIEKRALHSWVVLRSGEYLIETVNIRAEYDRFPEGTVSYRVTYEPPLATAKEVANLAAEGIMIPTKRLESVEEHFEYGGER